MVQNIDIAPTLIEAAEVEIPSGSPNLDGRSFFPLLQGRNPGKPWRKHILYEYHWEWNFPACPTTLAIRTDRWKFVYTHGLWDINGLYDLETDPHERHNLINVPAFQEKGEALKTQLFDELAKSGGLTMPIRPPAGDPYHDRKLKR
jgi:N-acetylglucosamine-6-sulfatase